MSFTIILSDSISIFSTLLDQFRNLVLLFWSFSVTLFLFAGSSLIFSFSLIFLWFILDVEEHWVDEGFDLFSCWLNMEGSRSVGVIRICFALVFGLRFILGVGGWIGDLWFFPQGIYFSGRFRVFFRDFWVSHMGVCYGFFLFWFQLSVVFFYSCSWNFVQSFNTCCISFSIKKNFIFIRLIVVITD